MGRESSRREGERRGRVSEQKCHMNKAEFGDQDTRHVVS